MNTVVAFPSLTPGGLDAGLSPHFGHCDVFTVVRLVDGEAGGVEVIPAIPHEQGGCMAPVRLLAENGVRILVAAGIGMRPLQGLAQAGIMAMEADGAATVGEALAALKSGQLSRFDASRSCQHHH